MVAVFRRGGAMSKEVTEVQDIDRSEDVKRVLAIGNGVVLVVLLFAAVVTLPLVFSLRSDVAALEAQVRESAKAINAMQGELEEARQRQRPAAENKAAPAARATYIDAADPQNDCVIRSGDRGGMTNCMAK